MNLTKEDCEQSLEHLIKGAYSRWHMKHGITAKPYYLREKPVYKGDYRALCKIERLIDEYFELIRKHNELEKQHMKLLLQWGKDDNKPLKFEDLKPDMWVWDDKNKLYVQIEEDFDEGNGNIILRYYEDSYNSNCERTKFKENRFYPVEKANEVQL